MIQRTSLNLKSLNTKSLDEFHSLQSRMYYLLKSRLIVKPILYIRWAGKKINPHDIVSASVVKKLSMKPKSLI